ncbi:hypothetical protein SAMN06296386_101369 [Lachnospiraceae bacterium]|nr:hypothetical protein SAMN06296386_101369 [Lachnospiraceae bacterium]
MSRSLGECLINSANALTDKEDKENADSVLQLALENNTKLFENLRKVKKMCEALTKLMKPEIDAAWSGGKAEGKSEGATELSAAAKRLNQGATPETLLLEGFSADVVKSAKELLDALK